MTIVVRLEDSIVCLKVRVCEGSEGIRRRNERRERRGDHLTYTGAHAKYTEGSSHYNDCRCEAGGFNCVPEGTCVRGVKGLGGGMKGEREERIISLTV